MKKTSIRLSAVLVFFYKKEAIYEVSWYFLLDLQLSFKNLHLTRIIPFFTFASMQSVELRCYSELIFKEFASVADVQR